MIELMIVVVVIGLLIAIAVPAFRKITESSRMATFINDCQVFGGAAQYYLFESGDDEIEDAGSGELPEDLEGYIQESAFEGQTPIGGQWDFDADYGFSGVGAVGSTLSLDALARLDESFDDGDWSTGQIRVFGADRVYRVYWVIE